MGTTSLRLRLIFKDKSILTKRQQSSDKISHCWFLLKPQQHRTISDVSTHLVQLFNLHRSCPNGILLTMEGFVLPPFESTEIFKDKEIICVKKKGGLTSDACNLLNDVLEPADDGLLLLENDNTDKGTKEYEGESEETDEEKSQDEELPDETISKKRKASTNLQNLKGKKQCRAAFVEDEDGAETEEMGNINNDAPSSKKVESPSTVKRSEELQKNVAEVKQGSKVDWVYKGPSRNARRKKAKRNWMQELAKISKKKPQEADPKPESTKLKIKEANDQPKGLLYWKQASKKPVQNGDLGTDEDRTAKQTGVSTEKVKWNCSSSKNNRKEWDREKFSTKRITKESLKMPFKDSKIPVIDPNDLDKLPPCSEPKKGDVIAYRLLELNSSWIPEFSSFRVGKISYYDAKDIVLVPVTEYPFVSEKNNEDRPNDSLYKEDGTLEINYSALIDVRNVKQYVPNIAKSVSDGVDQTPMSDGNDAAAENMVSNGNDNNIDAPKDSNPGEANPWDRVSSKHTEIPDPDNPSMVDSGLNRRSYDGSGPGTSTVQEANKAESSGVKENQKDNSVDPWLKANKPGPSQENNSSWSNVLGSTTKDCENGSSWGRPWPAVVSKSSSVVQQNKGNDWHAGGSRGSWKPSGAPRGRGRGRGGSHGRGRGRGRNGN